MGPEYNNHGSVLILLFRGPTQDLCMLSKRSTTGLHPQLVKNSWRVDLHSCFSRWNALAASPLPKAWAQ